jgi:hypothetical protein
MSPASLDQVDRSHRSCQELKHKKRQILENRGRTVLVKNNSISCDRAVAS